MRVSKWSIENLRPIAAQYQSRKDFKTGHSAAYGAASQMGLLPEITSHMPALFRLYTQNDLINEALKYDNTFDFRTKSPKHYNAAKQNKTLADITKHMRRLTASEHNDFSSGPTKWSPDKIRERAMSCSTIKQFRKIEPQAYDAAHRQGLITEMTAHMENARRKISHEEYIELCAAKKIKPLSIYQNSTAKMMHECGRCSYIWLAAGWRIINETGCPKCNKGNISPAEIKLTDWIESLGCDVVRSDRTLIKPLELDAYIPSRNLAVEFNGTYWHSNKEPDYHLNKTVRCAEAGVRLIHVWEHEANNRVMRSIIAGACGVFDRTIHARKCDVVTLNWSETAVFLKQNHIQGSGAPTGTNIALRYDGQIVAVMTFSKPRYDKRCDYELVRYACKLGTRVVGGASRMFKRRPAGSIVTYSDRRLFDGNLYAALGFTRYSESAPGYFYVNMSGETLQRYATQRSKLPALLGDKFDASLSEAKNMVRAGWHRVWDCGVVTWHHE